MAWNAWIILLQDLGLIFQINNTYGRLLNSRQHLQTTATKKRLIISVTALRKKNLWVTHILLSSFMFSWSWSSGRDWAPWVEGRLHFIDCSVAPKFFYWGQVDGNVEFGVLCLGCGEGVFYWQGSYFINVVSYNSVKDGHRTFRHHFLLLKKILTLTRIGGMRIWAGWFLMTLLCHNSP